MPPIITRLLDCLDGFLAQMAGYIHPDDPNGLVDPRTDEAVLMWNWREDDLPSVLERVAKSSNQPLRLVCDLMTVDELRKVVEKFFEFQWPLFDRPM